MKNINIKVSDELHAAIKSIAATTGRSMPEVVAEALAKYAEVNL